MTKFIVFLIFTFIIGFVLTYLTSSQYGKLPNTCVSKQVQLGLNIILMLSIMIMVIPIVQLYCHLYCIQNEDSYKWIIVTISFLLVTAASVVLNGLKDKCNTSSLKSYMIGLIVSGIILIVIIVVLPMIVPNSEQWINGSRDYSAIEMDEYTSVSAFNKPT